MASKILNNKEQKGLQPAYALWRLYAPEEAPLRFRARSLAEARKWQQTARKALGQALGFQSMPPAPFSPKVIEKVDKGDYVREKILLRTSRHTLMPVYLLLPKRAKRPLPVVLAFHGHGYGVKDIVGLWEDGAERTTPDGYQRHFAVEICKRGFAVAAPEISCFGERQTDFSHLKNAGQPSTCAHTAALAFHMGQSALGLRIYDGKRLVDYLETRRDMDTSVLGAMGISGGGMHTMFSTCMDERIKTCVISGYFSTFKDSVLAMCHCLCNYVPGMHQFGEMHDLAGLIAPRPFLAESGDHDSIFPIGAVRKSVAKAKAIYKVFGVNDGVEVDYFEGRHQISGRRAYDFLVERLLG